MRKFWDKLLMGNLLFLFFCFIWFVTLIVGNYGFNMGWGWELWRQAWTYVINPALGIFFLGVVVSVIQSKFFRSKNP